MSIVILLPAFFFFIEYIEYCRKLLTNNYGVTITYNAS